MGLMSEVATSTAGLQNAMRANARRMTLVVAALMALSATGCGQVQDIGEELGWIDPPARPAPPPAPVSMDKYWVPADTAVGGVAQAEWAKRWWQWAGRFPGNNDRPYVDPDGRRCAQFQGDDAVWFLAGTDGNFEALRTCSIPAGKHLFVPLINWFAVEGDCARKTDDAKRFGDHVLTGLVILDGRPIGDFKRMRAASGGCFDAFPGQPAGATDGYWLMLSPLPAGSHQLAITAAYRDGGKQMLQNFQYKLEVEGTPEAAVE